jgi:plastocyanin
VTDDAGKPLNDAVVFATPLAGKPSGAPKSAVIDQVRKEYVPHVSAVQVGAQVSFPNRDQIRHSVYSFSEPKTFELPLYKGAPSSPVVFDKPGVVVLGCNIHDWMKAYVYVTETAYFGVTDKSGKADLAEVPPGEYSVDVWHPRVKEGTESTAQRISVGSEGGSVSFQIELKRVLRPRRGADD